MTQRTLERLRKICLSFAGATEKLSHDEPTFRIRDKIFCAFIFHDGRPALSCKAPPGSQGLLVASDPKRFFVPRFVGHHGWAGVWLDGRVDWTEVRKIVERSYLMTAPKAAKKSQHASDTLPRRKVANR